MGRAKARELEEQKRRKRAREELYGALKHDRRVEVDSSLEAVAALYREDPAWRLVRGWGAGAGAGWRRPSWWQARGLGAGGWGHALRAGQGPD